MKELSIEEKAKAYDEAVEKIHRFIDGYSMREISKEEIEDIFPELKEREDERIRKDILDFIRREGQHIDKLEWHKWIAWLKKQGEQKPTNKVEPMSLDEAIEHCKEKSCGNNACALEHKQLKEWLTELKELRGHKPSEWSKEDEKIALSIEQIFNCASLLNIVPDKIEKVRSWLNSLRDRMLPLPKQEWSEEDKKIINGLIDSLTRISLNTRTDSTSPNYTFYKEIDWLKSLRPQNRWKPSEEQIIELRRVISGCSYDIEPLAEMEEQLKKLMEE